MEHTFHTRHDFTPELGWAAFQLLADLGEESVETEKFEEAARLLGSPVARRADTRKLLLSLEELGLLSRTEGRVGLSRAGRALAASVGRYEAGFAAGVDCLYSWGWLWSGQTDFASPSWSYRQVCREVRLAGAAGLEPDEVVMRIVAAAARFEAERVSFSRSSVNGVVGWLRVQTPPRMTAERGRIVARADVRPSMTSIRLHVAAAIAHRGGVFRLDDEGLGCLADALLVSPDEVGWAIREALTESSEFQLTATTPVRVSYRGTEDSFLEWIVHGRDSERN